MIERESPSAVWVLDRAFHIIRCGGSSAQAALEALNKLRQRLCSVKLGSGVDDTLRRVSVAVGKH